MRVHIIEGGIVANTIEAESVESAQALFPSAICIEATEGGIGWTYANGVLTAPVVVIPVPESVSPRQIRQAMTQVGLRDSVEAAIAAGDQDTKDWYQYATAFERKHPMVLALAQGLNVTETELDQLWTLAGSL